MRQLSVKRAFRAAAAALCLLISAAAVPAYGAEGYGEADTTSTELRQQNRGNLMGNLIGADGWAVQSGGWIYYVEYDEAPGSYYLPGTRLFRADREGDDRTRLGEGTNISQLNLSGERIYGVIQRDARQYDIVRLDTDGKGEKVLFSAGEKPEWLLYENGYLYFNGTPILSGETQPEGIYKVKASSPGIWECLCEGSYPDAVLDSGWVYYLEGAAGSVTSSLQPLSDLMRRNLTSGQVETVAEGCADYALLDGQVYLGGQTLSVCQPDGSGRQVLLDAPAWDLTATENWLYFASESEENDQLYRIHPDGSGLTSLADLNGVERYSVGDGMILLQMPQGHLEAYDIDTRTSLVFD